MKHGYKWLGAFLVASFLFAGCNKEEETLFGNTDEASSGITKVS